MNKYDVGDIFEFEEIQLLEKIGMRLWNTLKYHDIEYNCQSGTKISFITKGAGLEGLTVSVSKAAHPTGEGECLSRAMTRAIEDRIPVGVMEEQSEKGD